MQREGVRASASLYLPVLHGVTRCLSDEVTAMRQPEGCGKYFDASAPNPKHVIGMSPLAQRLRAWLCADLQRMKEKQLVVHGNESLRSLELASILDPRFKDPGCYLGEETVCMARRRLLETVVRRSEAFPALPKAIDAAPAVVDELSQPLLSLLPSKAAATSARAKRRRAGKSTLAHGQPAHGSSAHGQPAHGRLAHGQPAHGRLAHGQPAHGKGSPAHDDAARCAAAAHGRPAHGEAAAAPAAAATRKRVRVTESSQSAMPGKSNACHWVEEVLYGGRADDIPRLAKATVKTAQQQLSLYDSFAQDRSPQCNPLEWWKQRQHQLPCLAALARDMFSVPGSSHALERAFSHAGRGCDHRRRPRFGKEYRGGAHLLP